MARRACTPHHSSSKDPRRHPLLVALQQVNHIRGSVLPSGEILDLRLDNVGNLCRLCAVTSNDDVRRG